MHECHECAGISDNTVDIRLKHSCFEHINRRLAKSKAIKEKCNCFSKCLNNLTDTKNTVMRMTYAALSGMERILTSHLHMCTVTNLTLTLTRCRKTKFPTVYSNDIHVPTQIKILNTVIPSVLSGVVLLSA